MNKKVCQLCYGRHGRRWFYDDDMLWREGRFYCIKHNGDLSREGNPVIWGIENFEWEVLPPSRCHCVLEHAVLGQKRHWWWHLRYYFPWWMVGSLRK